MKTDIWNARGLVQKSYAGGGRWSSSAEVEVPEGTRPNQLYFILRFHRPCDLLVEPPQIRLMLDSGEWVTLQEYEQRAFEPSPAMR
jgi:hypothetical protein